MLTSLSLRIRVFLFFVLLGVGGAILAEVAIYVGFLRFDAANPANAFVFAGIVAAFTILGLTAGIWLLFDENVAKPIERLAAGMRTHAHAGVNVAMDTDAARYLGDLAPAAKAVSEQLGSSALQTAEAVAVETARLQAEKDRLTALLTEIPVAMVLINPNHEIVLYDAQAAEALGQVATPRLNASIFDYLCSNALLAAYEKLKGSNEDVSFVVKGIHDKFSFEARLKPLGHSPGYMLLIDEAHLDISPDAARPLIYDFDLFEKEEAGALEDTPITAMTYVVFDTETTGLLPHKDEICQIGAVRVVNGKIVVGEQIDQLVHPGMKIPAASTKVHHISCEMVADAPKIDEAAPVFHAFARDSVIVAHNAPFDMAFLKRHGKRLELEWNHPVIDTVLLSAVLFGASETHTLDALSDRLGVTIPEHLRHTALGDAQATAEVLCKLLPMLESRGFKTFGDVIAQTKKHGRLLEDLN